MRKIRLFFVISNWVVAARVPGLLIVLLPMDYMQILFELSPPKIKQQKLLFMYLLTYMYALVSSSWFLEGELFYASQYGFTGAMILWTEVP